LGKFKIKIEVYMRFPEVLKDLRVSRNLTQAELAKALSRVMGNKISKSAISMYENGNREPDFETLEAIADFFNVDFNKLTGQASYNSNEVYATKEEKQFYEIYKRAKDSDRVEIKVLIAAVDKLLKINGRGDEKKK
jgi:transcriptional regulator with XRE-family HTH domain